MIGMITIKNNFLEKELIQELENTSMVYSKVHWVGSNAKPENAFHKLVHKIGSSGGPYTLFRDTKISGATAWWNIRATPIAHSDLISYCTSNGVDYTPDPPPDRTYIYYLKTPEHGGRLNIYTKPSKWDETTEADSIAAIPNRLVSFPIEYIHDVNPYQGNRISIGVIFWHTLPTIYGETNPTINASYDRPWEKEENQEINRELTIDYMNSITND